MSKRIFLILIFLGSFIPFVITQSTSAVKNKIDSLLHQITIANNSEKFNDGLIVGHKALSIFEKNIVIPDTLLSNIYCLLGETYINLGEYSEAKTYFDKCLELRISLLGKENFKVKEAYFNLGMYYDYTSQFELAISYYNKFMDYCLEHLPQRQKSLTKVYFNIAICYAFLEDYEKSLKLNQKALEIDISIYGKDHVEIAYDLNNIGILYYYLNDLEKALTTYLECKRILEKNELGGDLEVARIELNIGSLFDKRNDYENAIIHLNNSLQIHRKVLLNSDYRIIDNLWILGMAYLNQGTPKKALSHLNQALHLAQSNPNITWETHKDILYHLSATHLELGQHQLAHELIQQAKNHTFEDSTQVHKSGNGYKQKAWANLQTLQADIFVDEYPEKKNWQLLKRADLRYEEALAFWQKRRQQFLGDQSKESWLEKHYETFEKAIACKLLLTEATKDQKYVQEAYTLAEQSRALLLLDALQATKANHYAGVPDSLVEKEKAIRESIATVDQSIFEMDQGDDLDSQLVALHSELFVLQNAYDSLLYTMEEEYPDYYQLRHKRSTTSVREIQENLLTNNQAVLQYFAGDSSLYVFLIRKDTFQVLPIPLDFPLHEWISEWRQSVEDYGNGKRENHMAAVFVDRSRKLYDHLLAPLEAELPDQLTIVADGVLGYLPFEALLASTPAQIGRYSSYDYFLHHHTISYAFSTTWWKEMLEENKTKKAAKNLLAMAPEFGNPAIAQLTRSTKLTPLRYNQEEAEGIVRLWGGKALTATAATKENFKTLAGKYQILHFATHAKANDQSGDYSFLAFTQIPDSIDNETLYARELYELSLNADLVVLSACETGIGELQKGEGIISLARGFSYAGARSILTTLWQVSDDKAAQLMKYFYKELKEQLPKDVALQNTKINYLANCRDREAHPFYWAAFVGLGNMESLQARQNWNGWAYGVATFLFLISVFFYFKKPSRSITELKN